MKRLNDIWKFCYEHFLEKFDTVDIVVRGPLSKETLIYVLNFILPYVIQSITFNPSALRTAFRHVHLQ